MTWEEQIENKAKKNIIVDIILKGKLGCEGWGFSSTNQNGEGGLGVQTCWNKNDGVIRKSVSHSRY